MIANNSNNNNNINNNMGLSLFRYSTLEDDNNRQRRRGNNNNDAAAAAAATTTTTTTTTGLVQVHNLAQFCREVGCTIQDYRTMTYELKRRKVELSKERLAVEDKIEKGSTSRSPLLLLLPEHRQHKLLSDRALAIQNLLATLQSLEDTGTTTTSIRTTTKQLADRYRKILRTEGLAIDIKTGAGRGSTISSSSIHSNNSSINNANANANAKNNDWDAPEAFLRSFLSPQSPHLPPTDRQFMVS